MNKNITVGQASYEAACESRGINSPREWARLPERMRFMWKCAGMAAVSAHFASIGARGGGKGTPAQARAARLNGMRNRKSKGKPRPVSRFADVTCEKCGCRFAVELWRGRQTVKNISTICAVCSPGSCK